MTEPTTLQAMLDDTAGIVGAWLCTASGEVRTVIRGTATRESHAASTAAVATELAALGGLLGLGELRVASVKAATAGRVVARRGDALLAFELDPRRSLGELEKKLATLAWVPDDVTPPAAAGRSTAAPPSRGGATLPPPPPSGARSDAAPTRPPFAAQLGEAAPLPPPPAAGGSAPISTVFAGDLEEFCIADLLQLLRNSHRTGLLTCTTRSEVATIQLSRGMIVGADSPHALDLRHHLLSSPDLAPEQRRAMAALPPESFRDDALDTAIVSRKLVAPADIERARIARIYSALREMFSWTSGRFSFDPRIPITAPAGLMLSTQSVLLHLIDDAG